jgi:all-trans-retinol dehydrogenase (NAD+)
MEHTEKLFKVNLISHFALIKEFLPGMLNQQKGHIVTMASLASFAAGAGMLSYCCSKVAALYLSEGIRSECLTRYPGGEAICTTSVHPSWHATGIIKETELDKLKKHGYKVGPASDVSDAVVEQVLKGKSGRLCVPKSAAVFEWIRTLPLWAQDVLKGQWRRKGKKNMKVKD